MPSADELHDGIFVSASAHSVVFDGEIPFVFLVDVHALDAYRLFHTPACLMSPNSTVPNS